MRVAVIGTGGVARRHLRVLARMQEVQIVGHLSSISSRAEEQAREWGGSTFSQLGQLLDAERPDAVWICVTPDRHGPLEFALIDARVPFFVEKPLSVDPGTAERVGELLSESPLVTAVGYKFRALETLPIIYQLLGETPARMVVIQWHDRMPPPDWWRHASQTGGQVVEQATHLLDLARILVGDASVLAGMGRRWQRAGAPGADVPDATAAWPRSRPPAA